MLPAHHTSHLMYRKEAISLSLNALDRGEVEEAVAANSDYYGGAGTLYEKETIEIMRNILECDYTPDPGIENTVLQPLRVVAAAMELWGAGGVREFAAAGNEWTGRLKPEVISDLLYAAGLEEHRLDRFRAAGVEEVTIHTRRENPAPCCREDAGKTFRIDATPPLPHPDPSCQCSYAAIRKPLESP